jgi:hypothetical protein
MSGSWPPVALAADSTVEWLDAVGPEEVPVLPVRVVLQVELDLLARPEVAMAVASDLGEVDEDATGSLGRGQAPPAFLGAPPLNRANDSRQTLPHKAMLPGDTARQ